MLKWKRGNKIVIYGRKTGKRDLLYTQQIPFFRFIQIDYRSGYKSKREKKPNIKNKNHDKTKENFS